MTTAAEADCDRIMGLIIALTDRLVADRADQSLTLEEFSDLAEIQVELEWVFGVPQADRLRGDPLADPP